MILTGCAELDTIKLASDELAGRNNGSAGSALARDYVLSQLRQLGVGANEGESGDAAYLQPFAGGTNVVAVIPGTDLADEYVMVGAHYDGLGSGCFTPDPPDTICNGATDNATGVAAVLDIARRTARTPLRRSLIIALWDREEDGLLGSRYYAQNPLVPLADTVGYVNFDILGANLTPALRNTTFAVGAESGGSELSSMVQAAVAEESLDTMMVSIIFGQGRSDHASLLAVGVPTVFFSDSTGPCYHTTKDDIGAVDFAKLHRQITTAHRVTIALGTTDVPPTFVPGTPLATFDDAIAAARVIERTLADLARFSPADQQSLLDGADVVRKILDEGRAAFGADDVGALLVAAGNFVTIMTHGPCSGFLLPA
jgi:Zn-dependent M28 family amino/carboxypeptidase